MGARIYIGLLGRFLQIDPIEGGTDNNYVYANDPVNEFDLTGEAIWIPLLGGCARFCSKAKQPIKWGANKAWQGTKWAGNKAWGGVKWAGNKSFGKSSYFFGSNHPKIGSKSGILNRKDNIVKIGWSHVGTSKEAYATFRIGWKWKGKSKHIDLYRGKRIW